MQDSDMQNLKTGDFSIFTFDIKGLASFKYIDKCHGTVY